jgi:histidine triad (HIT) family protein
MACAFCEIAQSRVAAAVVFEDRNCVAFLDHRPLFPGHCLVIPKSHYETMADLPDDALRALFGMARSLSVAVEKGLGAEGSFVAVNNRVSQSVPHVHIHVVPRRKKDGLKGFFWPRGKYRDEAEMEAAREILARTMAETQSIETGSQP